MMIGLKNNPKCAFPLSPLTAATLGLVSVDWGSCDLT